MCLKMTRYMEKINIQPTTDFFAVVLTLWHGIVLSMLNFVDIHYSACETL